MVSYSSHQMCCRTFGVGACCRLSLQRLRLGRADARRCGDALLVLTLLPSLLCCCVDSFDLLVGLSPRPQHLSRSSALLYYSRCHKRLPRCSRFH